MNNNMKSVSDIKTDTTGSNGVKDNCTVGRATGILDLLVIKHALGYDVSCLLIPSADNFSQTYSIMNFGRYYKENSEVINYDGTRNQAKLSSPFSEALKLSKEYLFSPRLVTKTKNTREELRRIVDNYLQEDEVTIGRSDNVTVSEEHAAFDSAQQHNDDTSDTETVNSQNKETKNSDLDTGNHTMKHNLYKETNSKFRRKHLNYHSDITIMRPYKIRRNRLTYQPYNGLYYYKQNLVSLRLPKKRTILDPFAYSTGGLTGVTYDSELDSWAVKLSDLTVLNNVNLRYGDLSFPCSLWGFKEAKYVALWVRLYAFPDEELEEWLLAELKSYVNNVFLYEGVYVEDIFTGRLPCISCFDLV